MRRTTIWILSWLLLSVSLRGQVDLTPAQSVQVCGDANNITASTGAAQLADIKTICQAATPPPVVVVPPPPVVPPAPATGRVVSLTHLGSFTAPKVGVYDADGYAYGGRALSFNPARQSLFMAGIDSAARIGEISIPALGGTATSLQAPVDPFGGALKSINPSSPNSKLVGGTLVYSGQLIVSAYDFYDGAGSQVLSHFVRPLTLTAGPVVGPTRVGPLGAGFYSGYMGLVPPEWQAKLGGPALTGNADLGVISRTSYGPSVAAFDPLHLGSAVELVGYPTAHQTLGPWSGSNKNFGGADRVTGVVFPAGTSTVIFVGRHGGTFCYGPGTSNAALVGTLGGGNPDPYCFDPADASKGVHGYPYAPYAWLYDANDLATVKAGAKQPWDVRPYATLTLSGIGPAVGGAAYDPATGRIYISEQRGSQLPLVHVYQVQ